MSQYATQSLFTKDAVVMSLPQILETPNVNDVVYVTTIRTLKVIPTRSGWYYKLCALCPRSAKGDTLPIKCSIGHLTHAINLRYKLDVEVESRGAKSTFVFWDRECNELIGKTAAQLHQEMVEDGVTNPLSYPMDVDKIERRNLAVRVKWQPLWKSFSVQAVKQDDAVFNDIESQFPKDEETSKLCIEGTSTAAEGTSIVATDAQPILIAPNPDSKEVSKDSEFVAETQDLSASSEHIPEVVALTPGKRIAGDFLDQNNDISPAQLSSTKMKKIITIKLEKK
ncbi:replication protein A1-like protein [Trifolium medium]|uniref:Replication protein A1-like protein n=3 Tax=Trifolium medium TaxID=97028 RepID=A0A392M2Z6_9FABA|nr:replication protein A1-like protein [Trifolium medium]